MGLEREEDVLLSRVRYCRTGEMWKQCIQGPSYIFASVLVSTERDASPNVLPCKLKQTSVSVVG